MSNLKLLRTKNSKTQKDVAEYLGVSRSTYTTYEIGSRDIPTDVLIKLSNLYEVSIDYILGVCSLEQANYEMIEDKIDKASTHLKYIDNEFKKLNNLTDGEKSSIHHEVKRITNDLKDSLTIIKKIINIMNNDYEYECDELLKALSDAMKRVDHSTRKRMVDTLKAAFPYAFDEYEWALDIIKQKNITVYTQLKDGKTELSKNDIINMAKALEGNK